MSALAIKIYTDENVNPAIAEGLQKRGVKAWTAADTSNLGLTDEEQLEYTSREHAVLFTHDSGLISIARKWVQLGKEHWGVFYVYQDDLSIGECIRRLKDYANILEAEDMKNRVEFL